MNSVKPKVLRNDGKQRDGKGFSRDELKKAGSNPKEALRLHIPLDVKRRTAHEENVEKLKTILQAKKTVPTAKRKTKGQHQS